MLLVILASQLALSGSFSMALTLKGLLEAAPNPAMREITGGLLSNLDVSPQAAPARIQVEAMHTPRAVGKDVVFKAIDKVSEIIGDTNPVAKKLLKYTINEESKYGKDPLTFKKRTFDYTDDGGIERIGTVGHGGVGQVTNRAFKEIVSSLVNAKEKSDAGGVYKKLKSAGLADEIQTIASSGNESIEKYLEIPFNSVLMARLKYRLINAPLPGDSTDELKQYRDKYYLGRKSK